MGSLIIARFISTDYYLGTIALLFQSGLKLPIRHTLARFRFVAIAVIIAGDNMSEEVRDATLVENYLSVAGTLIRKKHYLP
jgi:hypothetical protein